MSELKNNIQTNESLKEAVNEARELSIDELNKVVGAGDPNEALLRQSRQTQNVVEKTSTSQPIVLPELP